MDDNPTSPGPDEHAPCSLAREGHVMRTIVRNMVVNMECVLSDLQGIMGDIQSLVVQIDTVTEKIDKQCGNDTGGSQGSPHRVQKPVCMHGSMTSAGVCQHPSSQCASDFPKQPFNPLAGTSHQRANPIRTQSTVEHWLLKGGSDPVLRRDPSSQHCAGQAHRHSRSKSGEAVSIFEKRDQMERNGLGASKSLLHFPKESAGIPVSSSGGIPVPSSGGIAVVHPTVHNNPKVPHVNTDADEKMKEKPEPFTFVSDLPQGLCIHPVVQCMPLLAPKPPQAVLPNTLLKLNELSNSFQKPSKKRHSVTSVYNKSFQPVTPTEQQSPVTQPKTVNNFKISLASSKENQPPLSSIVLPQEAHLRLSRNVASLPSSPRLKRSATCVSQTSKPNSPRMRRSSTKAIYSKIDGSTPSTIGRSSGSVRIQQPSPHHYYHSIDSDLDSDLVEWHDNRSMTPDIDWSYLNLVGNQRTRPPLQRLGTIDSDGYEKPVIQPARASYPFQILQTSPDVVSRLPVFRANSSLSEDTFLRASHCLVSNVASILEKVYNSPVMTHVFCAEVSSAETGFYCGCYEAVVDSVLENVAGFETFEEACQDFDTEAVVNESYVSFDDEFEEDDWDMGLRPEDNDIDLPSFNMDEFYDNDTFLFGSLDDVNKNILETADSSMVANVTGEKKLSLYDNKEESPRLSTKRRLSPSTADENVYDDMELLRAIGNSFTDEDCCAMKPNLSGYHPNFTLWPKSSSRDAAGEKTAVGVSEQEMMSLSETSCQAVGSGSPMSFSSPEAAFTSPDTDRFVTSSEGDDLLTSQEESYFLSEQPPVTSQYHNVNVASPKASMKQLRREFFESLYTVCERRDKELGQHLQKRLSEESVGFPRFDNSRDVSDADSYTEDLSSYNRNVNTWTAYAMVHVQADDVSDTASDIINDNNVTCSMSSSYIDADNIGAASGNQGLSF
ncbi:uncharacterized protein LOC131939652 [Physella acuta]|uniref:uncharacterized protein LOC131939652 n=1 Tax=Physella acuta TaxID=109671 RepID=UPI0027DBEB77|nr:uncharacterized protein LOC131939652 [Physella acuta]XP_059154084.1 uncharacterized protein LOC131939652 [Physella acuta]XP_059154085.1 uncharacterized protein LOC131939652 [Physella acuta]XP_059154086.1 uncharacterized protein LOC131939652 [Physella acuta]XP_059154087.1 uncharacterized protein LOC131939652 [Physella acuta]XP_059154088.1 uncharacterized protein LOC131939652 [Physella acuta]XP_059154089.1 uncharacterized protein LOC131939652 [Physella acuta]